MIVVVRTETVSVPMQTLHECLSMRETYCLRIGPATIEISGSERTVRLSAYGYSTKVPIVERDKQIITVDRVRLVVEADRYKNRSNFTLEWDDQSEEKGQVATSYTPTTTEKTFLKDTVTNMLVDNYEFSKSTWNNTGDVWNTAGCVSGVKYYPEQLSQEQMNAITSDGRDKRLLLL